MAAWWQGGTQREGWVREKDGSARVTAPGPVGIHLGKMGTTTPPIYRDQAVRARFRLGDSPYLTLGVCRSLQDEGQARGYYAAFAAGKSSITLTLDSPGMASHAELAAVPLPKGLDRAATHTMELRYAKQQLTLILDGQMLYEKPHTQHTQGYSMLNARQGAIVESLEMADLGGGAVSQSPSLPVSSSSVVTATKDAPFTNTLGMKFVPVPGTQVLFSIWDTRVQDYAAYAQAQEAAGKKVDGAWKTQNKDGVPVGREPDHPVVGVSWEDAQAFCQWLTAKESAEGKLPKGHRYRLPTDGEWSTAAGLPSEQGATPEEKNTKNNVVFPWGKDFPPVNKVGNYADEAFHAQFPVVRIEKENLDGNL